MWGEGRRLRSNINVGDRIMHGDKNWKSRYPQVSLVVHKLLILGLRCDASHDGSAPAERIDRFEYQIGCNIGGHSPQKTHGDLTCGYWIWIPWFEQLVALGINVDLAARLTLGYEAGGIYRGITNETD